MRGSVLGLWVVVGACATETGSSVHHDAGAISDAAEADGDDARGEPDAADDDAGAGDGDGDSGPRPEDAGPRPDLGFVDDEPVARDAGPPRCPPGPCDLERQVGCEPPFPVCDFGLVPGVGPSPYCRPLGGRTDGQPCNRMFSCAAGYSCVLGACRRFCCSGDSTLCPPGQTCIGRFVAPGEVGSEAGFCAGPDRCDPVHQTGCVPEEYCFVAGPDVTDCVPPGRSPSVRPACTAMIVCAAQSA